MTIEATEQEFQDYVNSRPKQNLYSSIDLGVNYDTDMLVADFVALCQRSLEELPVALRDAARVWINDDGIEFRARREETNDEHIARCSAEFNMARLQKHNRFLQYQRLKQEFGNA